ncbi:Nucleotidyltransferase [Schizophyllum commune H4-8]|uniref:DNA-directed DNA polymerase n=1 Tax=Schizophyllum commune (strain H4-8 / FGSC 9210) TaxID=578458 RepID=D8Q9V7_SCHCM|nr:Nucleotidyltransferase [Schizophyllum commune H4-8]KAI5890266.1 Nucleotidyltransferase [Schizophyllum commune H4-8]
MSPAKRSRSSSYATSDESDYAPRKRQRSASSSDSSDEHRRLKVYIVQAKLDSDEVARLYNLVETHSVDGGLDFELAPNPNVADVIVTAVRMRKRLERHVDWELAKSKSLVTPDWLTKSVEANELLPCGDFAALRELRDQTIKHCPGDNDGDTISTAPTSASAASASGPDIRATESQINLQPPAHEPALPKLDYRSRYACCRASPLVCPNQNLVSRLAIIRRSRELEDDRISALSYDHAIGVTYPYEITEDRLNDVSKLPHIGKKMIAKLEEYVETGDIEEAATIAASQRFQSLEAFTDLYGVGATTARKLYAAGCKTFEDVERYYGVDTGAGRARSGKQAKPSTTAKPKIPSITPRVALELREDLAQRIPRGEVEAIHAAVVQVLDEVRPGCVTVVVGGYRRGKSLSGDVDIVIGHPKLSPTGKKVKGLSNLLVERLFERGLVTHLMYLSGFHTPDVSRSVHWDALEKALTVFVLPGGVHRRVDLIFAAPEAYWTAVVGWTGSKTFERDIRRWAADQKGLKFDSTGLTRRSNGEILCPKSEEDVFRMLGLDWIPPTLRNADA